MEPDEMLTEAIHRRGPSRHVSDRQFAQATMRLMRLLALHVQEVDPSCPPLVLEALHNRLVLNRFKDATKISTECLVATTDVDDDLVEVALREVVFQDGAKMLNQPIHKREKRLLNPVIVLKVKPVSQAEISKLLDAFCELGRCGNRECG